MLSKSQREKKNTAGLICYDRQWEGEGAALDLLRLQYSCVWQWMEHRAPRDTPAGGLALLPQHPSALSLVQAQTATALCAAQKGTTIPAYENSQLSALGERKSVGV